MLKDEAPTNGVTLRGFARYPKIATFQEVYGLKAAAIAVYPMYKGLARLVGMDVLDCGTTLGDQVDDAEEGVERLRLLLPALQVHRQHRRGRQLPGQGGDDRAVRRGDPAGAGAEAGRADRDRRPQHAEQDEEPLVAPGADGAVGGDGAGRTR